MRKFYFVLFLVFSLVVTNSLEAQDMQSRETQDAVLQCSVAAVEGRIIVSNAPVNEFIRIYSLVGVKVMEQRITQPRQEFFVNLPVGYYIVKIGSFTHKITIR